MTELNDTLAASLARAVSVPVAQMGPLSRHRVERAVRELEHERHDLMLASLDDRWWAPWRGWRRLNRLEAVERELGMPRRRGLPW